MQVFISYRNLPEYVDWTERLKTWLKLRNYDVWLDRYNIERGISPDSLTWRKSIAEGIRASQVMLVIYAPECFDSEIVIDEWEIARANGLRVYFLKVKDVPIARVLPGYVHVQYLNMARTDAWDVLQSDLTQAEKTPTPTPPSSDPFAEYVRDAWDTFFTLIEHRTDQHTFKEIDVRVDNTPQQVQTPYTPSKPRVDAMKSKLFMREGMQSVADQTVKEIEIGSVQEGMDKLHGRLLLLGDPGAGKTFTLYRYARTTLKDRLDNPSGALLPIYLICSTWQEGQTLIEWIHDQWQSLQSLRERDLQNALLLLDGFDELGTSRIRKVKDDEGKEFEESYDPRPLFLDIIPKAGRVLLSCRIREYEDFGTKVDLNGAVTLRPLTETQIHEYLADMPDLWDALSNDAELLEVMKTPLLLSLFAFGYKDAPDAARALRDLNAAQLSEAIFKQYVHKRYEHEALRFEDMGQAPPFTLDEVYDVLGQVAMINASGGWRVKDNVLTVDDFLVKLKTKARVQEFTAFSSLINLITPIEDAFRFIHLRVRDHFVRAYCYPRVGDERSYGGWGDDPSPALALASLPNAESVDALVVQINHNNSSVRQAIVSALGKNRDARMVELLIIKFEDANAGVRLRTAKALGIIRDARAVEPLIAALKDVDAGVRLRAAEALGVIGDARAVEPLIAALKDTDKSVRRSTTEALGVIRDARAVEPLIAALKDTDKSVRRSTTEALGIIRDARAVEPLIAALKDENESVRYRAAEALGVIGDARAVESLIAALKDADWRVRSSTAWALGVIGWTPQTQAQEILYGFAKQEWSTLLNSGEHAVSTLIAALKDANWGVRSNAAEALREIGSPSVEPLIAALKDADWEVRDSAAKALGKIGDARAVESLIKCLGDYYLDEYSHRNETSLAKTAKKSLVKIGVRAVEPLIAALKDADWGVRSNAAEALAKIGAPAVESLIASLRDANKDVRDYAQRALESIGTPEALAALEEWHKRQHGE